METLLRLVVWFVFNLIKTHQAHQSFGVVAWRVSSAHLLNIENVLHFSVDYRLVSRRATR